MITVEDAQAQLQTALEDVQGDLAVDGCEVDEGSIVSDLIVSLSYDWPPEVTVEVARREIGWLPLGCPNACGEAWDRLVGDDDDLW